MGRPAFAATPSVSVVVGDSLRLARLVGRAVAAESRSAEARDEARRCWVEAGLILLAHKGEQGFRVGAGLSERQAETGRSYARAWKRAGSPRGANGIAVPSAWDDFSDKQIQGLGRSGFPPGGEVPARTAALGRSQVEMAGSPGASSPPGVCIADGRARLVYGVDVLQGLASLPDQSVDMVGMSFPWPCSEIDYAHAGQYGKEVTREAAMARVGPVSRELHRVLRDGGSVWMEYGDAVGPEGALFLDSLAAETFRAAAPWVLAQRCMKVLTNPRPCAGDGPLIPATTSVFLFWKLGCTAYFDKLGLHAAPGRETVRSRIREGWDDDQAHSVSTVAWNVFFVPRTCHHARPHPAPFSPRLAEAWIKLSCSPGGVVLDPFSGAGSTGMAALGLGRSYIGIDIQADYLDIAARNLEAVVVLRT